MYTKQVNLALAQIDLYGIEANFLENFDD